MGQSLIDYIITTPDVAMSSRLQQMPCATVHPRLVDTDHLPVTAVLPRPVLRRSSGGIRLKLNATAKDFKLDHGELQPKLQAYQSALAALQPAYLSLCSVLGQLVQAGQANSAAAVQKVHEQLIAYVTQAVNAESSFGFRRVWTGKSVGWWSTDLTAAVTARTQAFMAFRALGSTADWQAYQQ